jgi:hypothetical protein
VNRERFRVLRHGGLGLSCELLVGHLPQGVEVVRQLDPGGELRGVLAAVGEQHELLGRRVQLPHHDVAE